MDNKTLYKKISTRFWWYLTIAPFITLFICYLITLFNIGFVSGGCSLSSSDLLDYLQGTINDSELYDISFNMWDNFGIPDIRNIFDDLFNTLNVPFNGSWSYALGFMVSVQIYHICFDLFCLLPNLVHKFIER